MKGQHERSTRKIEFFREVIHDLNLLELKGSGPFYTWKAQGGCFSLVAVGQSFP